MKAERDFLKLTKLNAIEDHNHTVRLVCILTFNISYSKDTTPGRRKNRDDNSTKSREDRNS